MLYRKQRRAERRMKRDYDACILLEGFAKRDCRSWTSREVALGLQSAAQSNFLGASVSRSRPIQPDRANLFWRNGTMAGVKFLE